MGLVLMILGYGVAFVGAIWVIVLAFQESPGWGVGGLIQLIFVIQNWDSCWKPFLMQIGGGVLAGVGAAIAAPAA